MRIHGVALTVVALLCLAPTFSAFATGNVLLPNDNSNGGQNLPNLGLTPTYSSESAEPPPPPPPSASETKATDKSQNTTPTVKANNSSNAPAVAAPLQQYLPQNPSQPQAYMPENPLRNASYGSVTLNLESSRNWTSADAQIINEQLGLLPAEIPSHCRMGLGGMVATDMTTVNMKDNQASVTVNYPGAMTNAFVSVNAICDRAPKPAQYSSFQQIGNVYVGGLTFTECDIPKGQYVRKITISHTGTGTDTCQMR